MIRRRILQKKLRPYVSGQRASLQSMDHVALGVIPKSRPNSGYWNPALEEEEIVSVVVGIFSLQPIVYGKLLNGYFYKR